MRLQRFSIVFKRRHGKEICVMQQNYHSAMQLGNHEQYC